MEKTVGVPSTKKAMHKAEKALWGGAGALLIALAQKFAGAGWLGGLLGLFLLSFMDNEATDDVAVILGFFTVLSFMGGSPTMISASSGGSSTSSWEVI